MLTSAFHPNEQTRLLTDTRYDPIAELRRAVRPFTPWDTIVDFARHPDFCGLRLYPRQLTLLKLIFLETENMTAYDVEVINEWRMNFTRRRDRFGVQPDIWERIDYLKKRGARRFPHIQMVLGRRGSKGMIGGILGAELIAWYFSLDDWHAHYEVADGKVGYINVGATSQTQAKMHQFADIRATVEGCKYLQPHIAESKDHALAIRTPADVRMIAEMKAAGVPIEHMIATLQVQALSANASAFRGATAFGLFLDEFAFMIHGTGSVKSGEEIYEDAHPSLDQFDLDGLTYIPSSPATKIGKAYSLYQEGSVLMSSYRDEHGIGEAASAELMALAAKRGEDTAEVIADPTKLICQLPSWGLYTDWERAPQLVGGRPWKKPHQWDGTHESQIRRKIRNPEKFKVEREGQWAEVMGAYFDEGKIDKMFYEPGWRDPLTPQSRGYLTRKYRIHCDPGRTGANFALCVGHTEIAPCDRCGAAYVAGSPWEHHPAVPVHTCPLGGRQRPHVIIDLLKVWKPEDFPPDEETGRPTIDYVLVQEDIRGILQQFPSTTKISFDQWNSALGIRQLRNEFAPSIRVTEVTFTEAENQRRFEKVKAALNLEFVHAYRDQFYEEGGSLLESELKFLAEVNGRVVKQNVGPVTTKDLCDSFCVVVSDLLHQELEVNSTDMPSLTVGSTDARGLQNGREQERVLAATAGANEPGQRAREQMGRWQQGRSDRRNAYQPSRLSSIHSRRDR